MKTPWKNSEEQYYSQKETIMKTQNNGIARRSLAKMWRRKPDCEQTKNVDTKQNKYFCVSEHLQEEDIANRECLEHDSIEILRKEARQSESLIGDGQHEWAL